MGIHITSNYKHHNSQPWSQPGRNQRLWATITIAHPVILQCRTESLLLQTLCLASSLFTVTIAVTINMLWSMNTTFAIVISWMMILASNPRPNGYGCCHAFLMTTPQLYRHMNQGVARGIETGSAIGNAGYCRCNSCS